MVQLHTKSDNRESINLTALVDNVMQNDTSHLEEFDCENFFKIISNDFRKNNIGNMLHYMSESMNISFEKQKVQGSISSLPKVQSLQGRWFSVREENVKKSLLETLLTVMEE